MATAKPCPFCGAQANVKQDLTLYFSYTNTPSGDRRTLATCSAPNCHGSSTWHLLDDWNKRPVSEIDRVTEQFTASLKTEREAKEEAQQTIKALIEAMDVILGGPDDIPLGALKSDKTIRENWKKWREQIL